VRRLEESERGGCREASPRKPRGKRRKKSEAGRRFLLASFVNPRVGGFPLPDDQLPE
jgi:hypothetical protein